jgi:hypothetical protein
MREKERLAVRGAGQIAEDNRVRQILCKPPDSKAVASVVAVADVSVDEASSKDTSPAASSSQAAVLVPEV